MKYLAVGLAAVIGANLRYSITLLVAMLFTNDWLPFATFLANITGAFLLGFFIIYFARFIHKTWYISIRTGLIGSFTTFSAFSVEAMHLFQENHISLAFLYIFASVICSFFFAVFGMRIAKNKGELA